MKGFDLQTDDYIVMPFPMKLVIRLIEAVLRRKQRGTDSAGLPTVFIWQGVRRTSNCVTIFAHSKGCFAKKF